jgi:hypothetical protein
MLLLTDSTDRLHAFWEGFNVVSRSSAIFYAEKGTDDWSVPVNISNDTMHSVEGFYSIVDSSGTIHLVWNRCEDQAQYYCSGNQRIFYAWKPSGGEWSVPEPIASPGLRLDTFNYLGKNVMAVDSSGTLHLVVMNGYGYSIYYIHKIAGGVWSSPEIIPGSGCWDYESPAIALDSTGSPHVIWGCDSSSDYSISINYSNRQGGGWSSVTNVSGS